MRGTAYLLAAICIVALTTWLTRALPFLAFRKRELPDVVRYLGKVLPPAIMVILVVYCLRSIHFTLPPHGLPEGIAALLVVFLQVWKKNMYISIVAGTVCYMLLIRVMV